MRLSSAPDLMVFLLNPTRVASSEYSSSAFLLFFNGASGRSFSLGGRVWHNGTYFNGTLKIFENCRTAAKNPVILVRVVLFSHNCLEAEIQNPILQRGVEDTACRNVVATDAFVGITARPGTRPAP